MREGSDPRSREEMIVRPLYRNTEGETKNRKKRKMCVENRIVFSLAFFSSIFSTSFTFSLFLSSFLSKKINK